MPRLSANHRLAFYRDRRYLAAVGAGGVLWLAMALWMPVQSVSLIAVFSWPFLSLICWQPWWEEVLFRGLLQGELGRYWWGQKAWHGVTLANGVTSLLFSLGHCWAHPPLWAMAVVIPSLLFGYYRDRYTRLYPSIILHAFYNAGYFMLSGVP